MNRSELIDTLATQTDSTKAAAAKFLDSFINTVQTAVKSGEGVSLVGFGTFKSATRAARTGRNPSTGAVLKIAAGVVPKFTAGAVFKAVVDPKAAKRKAAKAAAAPAAKPAAKTPAKAVKAKK